MGHNVTEAGRKAMEIKAQKRSAALRENLKRRKNSEAVKTSAQEKNKGERDAKPEDRQ